MSPPHGAASSALTADHSWCGMRNICSLCPTHLANAIARKVCKYGIWQENEWASNWIHLEKKMDGGMVVPWGFSIFNSHPQKNNCAFYYSSCEQWSFCHFFFLFFFAFYHPKYSYFTSWEIHVCNMLNSSHGENYTCARIMKRYFYSTSQTVVMSHSQEAST